MLVGDDQSVGGDRGGVLQEALQRSSKSSEIEKSLPHCMAGHEDAL